MQRLCAYVRDHWLRTMVFGAALLIWALTTRYCLTVHLTGNHSIGLGAGAAFYHERTPTTPSAGPFARRLKPDRRVIYFYRHGYTMQWWYETGVWTEVALWPLVILAALPLALGALRWVPPGHCGRCRYDLRGIAADVCPECGTPIASRR